MQQACLIALEYGLGYMWIDTCCIDKTSSVEMSEAINSMFKWYQDSQICITYLSDVSDEVCSHLESTLASGSFGSSRWFTRSWTLQELIAPKRLLFFSRNWRLIADRDDIWLPLYEITAVDPDVFGGRGLSKIPAARKMFWAARRHATRPEDVAYSLMGIFDVLMPLRYGEGEKAFLRLQKEITRETEDDATLFAWCPRHRVEPPVYSIAQGVIHGPFERFMPWNVLADSPARFGACGRRFPPLGAKGQYAIQRIGERHAEATEDEGHKECPECRQQEAENDISAVVNNWKHGYTMHRDVSTIALRIRNGLMTATSLLLSHEELVSLFIAAIRKSQISDERFKRNLIRVLRQFGSELKSEANHKTAKFASFLRQYGVTVASAITIIISEAHLEHSKLGQARAIPEPHSEEGILGGEPELDFEDEVFSEEDMPREADEVDFMSKDACAFIFKSIALKSMLRRLNDLVNPSFRSQAQNLAVKVLKDNDTGRNEYWKVMKKRMDALIIDLEDSRSGTVQTDLRNTTSQLNRFQIWVEAVTGEVWNWWPLHPPKHPLRPSEVRIGWQCFEKFCHNGFAHRGLEVPTENDYYYTPRPAVRDPPVSPEEFSHIYQYTAKRESWRSLWTLPFYSCVESLSDDTVGCIPQRYYYLDEKSNRKEDFWGLYIQERRSALMTSFYIVLCLSPFIIFCILYLLGIIQGDVQNATTPLALALTLLGLFLGSMIKA
ncbi:Vegetative incompatibility protein HET-E-1 [Colletotrichum tropicale]|nr:Vegetative incompatibility protein HET-E-1 [Colletotrichum tropicale]